MNKMIVFYLLELPWDEPSKNCKEYVNWVESKKVHTTPWIKIDTLSLGMLC